MDAQDFRSLQEAYLDVYQEQELDEGFKQFPEKKVARKIQREITKLSSGVTRSERLSGSQPQGRQGELNLNRAGRINKMSDVRTTKTFTPVKDRRKINAKAKKVVNAVDKIKDRQNATSSGSIASKGRTARFSIEPILSKEQTDLYNIILSHLLDEGYADTEQAAEAIMVNMSEDWRQDIMEKENSEYEKASDAALDKRYGYGRASGDKRSFGRAANRSSAAAALRAIRRGERSGSGTSREAGADAVHQGWAKTAKTSTDQTPEKKERRAGLANTPYSNLPDDEKEKDRVSFDAVRATYNKNKR